VAARCENHHDVEGRRDQVIPVGEDLWNAIPICTCFGQSLVEVTHGLERETIIELPKMVQVHDLGDHPAADDADA
jgi:hypothetical protein